MRFVFQFSQSPKKIIPKNYPELEIWINCLLIWAGISSFKLRIVFGIIVWEIRKTNLTFWKKSTYRISSYSFRGNYSFLNLEIQRSQYIKVRKLYEEIRYKYIKMAQSKLARVLNKNSLSLFKVTAWSFLKLWLLFWNLNHSKVLIFFLRPIQVFQDDYLSKKVFSIFQTLSWTFICCLWFGFTSDNWCIG